MTNRWSLLKRIPTAVAIVAGMAMAFAPAPVQAAPRTVDGLWQVDGYGMAVSVQDGRLQSYETTGISCLSWFGATRSSGPETGGVVRFVGDGIPLLTLRPVTHTQRVRMAVSGSTGTRELLPIARLPEACSRTLPTDPVTSFDVFWQTFAENYPFFRQHGVDWDAVRATHRRLVRPDMSEDELFGVLRSMIEPLHDAHTALVAHEGHRFFGIREGTPDRSVMEKRALDVTDSHLPGTRRTWADDAITYADLSGRLGYLRINRFAGYADDSDFPTDSALLDQALDDILGPIRTHGARALRGLIIDVRLNQGGSDALANQLAARLTERPYLAYRKEARNNPVDAAGRTRAVSVPIRPGPRPRYTGPIAVLTSRLTVSAGETFAQALLGRRPAPVRIGQPTQGVFSDTMPRTLPNGWQFALPNEEYRTATGQTFDITGIPPTVECAVFTPSELNDGTDSALRAARAALTSRRNG